jgi:hypothetical protein
VQASIADELDTIGLLHKPGAPPPRELELDDLKRMPTLSAALKEVRAWVGFGRKGREGLAQAGTREGRPQAHADAVGGAKGGGFMWRL